jgi:hypothetical protein
MFPKSKIKINNPRDSAGVNDSIDLFKDSKFLANHNKNNNDYNFNIKEIKFGEIGYNPENHVCPELLIQNSNNKYYIDYDTINQYLMDNCINLTQEDVIQFFNTFTAHNNIRGSSKQVILQKFLNVVKMYFSFKKNTPVFNNLKQNRIPIWEKKNSEIDTNLNQTLGTAKSMSYFNRNRIQD